MCERASTLFKDKSTDVTLNTTTFITLTLEDGDDQDPRFSHVTNEIWLPEENASVVWSYFETTPPIYAYDMDLGINATVEYAIVGNGKFCDEIYHPMSMKKDNIALFGEYFRNPIDRILCFCTSI